MQLAFELRAMRVEQRIEREPDFDDVFFIEELARYRAAREQDPLFLPPPIERMLALQFGCHTFDGSLGFRFGQTMRAPDMDLAHVISLY